jgi:outer membrane immunogenic protein
VKKFLLAGLAVGALIAPAAAADMPIKAPPAPIHLWTGFYVGANAGYSWSANNSVQTVGVPGSCNGASPGCIAGPALYSSLSAQAATFSAPVDQKGVLVGGQVGYNWVASSTLFGFEADLQSLSGNNNSASLVSAVPTPLFPGFPVNQTATVSTKLDFLGTVRARVGYLWGPSFLVYVTGGLAYGETKINSSIAQSVVEPGALGPYSGVGTDSEVRFGGTIGAGLEWMVFQHWSVKAEYLFVGLGRASTNAVQLVSRDFAPGFVGTFSSASAITSANFNESIFRGGINYHF